MPMRPVKRVVLTFRAFCDSLIEYCDAAVRGGYR